MNDSIFNTCNLFTVGFGVGIGTGVAIRLFDWIMQEFFHEGHHHDE